MRTRKIVYDWIVFLGAACGLVLAVLEIVNHLFAPSPPKLHAYFLDTKTTSTCMPASGTATIEVRNGGGRTAFDVVARLIYPAYATTFVADATQNTRPIGNSNSIVSEIRLGDLHPGYTRRIDLRFGDRPPPEAPKNLRFEDAENGVRLSWDPVPAEKIDVALYARDVRGQQKPFLIDTILGFILYYGRLDVNGADTSATQFKLPQHKDQ